MSPARPTVVSQTEWDSALAVLEEREVAVAEAMHQLAAARKRMPMVRVEHDYQFEGPDGLRSLLELFDGRSQLVLYRFYFEEGVDGWPDAGCAGCSSFADGIPELGLLHARDITFAMASPAPQANLRRYAERMGWTRVPWYTICTEGFSADFGVDEWFGLNVFLRDGDAVYRTYFLQHGPMVQCIGSVWSMFSLTPYGGQGGTRTSRRAGRRRPGRSGIAVMTSSTSRRRRPGVTARRRDRLSGGSRPVIGGMICAGGSRVTGTSPRRPRQRRRPGPVRGRRRHLSGRGTQ